MNKKFLIHFIYLKQPLIHNNLSIFTKYMLGDILRGYYFLEKGQKYGEESKSY